MYRFLILCICVSAVMADDGHGFGGGGFGFSSSIRAPAFTLPIPAIGFTFDKLPLFLPIPKIVLGKSTKIVSAPVVLPGSSFGGGFDFGLGLGGFGLGHGFGGHGVKHITIHEGGHGGHGGHHHIGHHW